MIRNKLPSSILRFLEQEEYDFLATTGFIPVKVDLAFFIRIKWFLWLLNKVILRISDKLLFRNELYWYILKTMRFSQTIEN